MADKPKRRWPIYLAVVLVLMLVVYPLSIGPAVVISYRANCQAVDAAVVAIYGPFYEVEVMSVWRARELILNGGAALQTLLVIRENHGRQSGQTEATMADALGGCACLNAGRLSVIDWTIICDDGEISAISFLLCEIL
jgi:hypothetical protein